MSTHPYALLDLPLNRRYFIAFSIFGLMTLSSVSALIDPITL